MSIRQALDILIKKIRYKVTQLPFCNAIIKAQNRARIAKSAPAVRAKKNMHKGERCFIIGNGPSLTPEDLTKIKDEISFATNGVYKIFDQTEWRPTYYCIQDWQVIHDMYKDIRRLIPQNVFVGLMEKEPYPRLNAALYLKINLDYDFPNPPNFSENIETAYSEGLTVTYMCMQIAIYMGFKEIFLLGLDHSYSKTIDLNGKLIDRPDTPDHFQNSYARRGSGPVEINRLDLAYRTAKKYADSHGIKIYNATRGGKLEVFERVDFDALFNK